MTVTGAGFQAPATVSFDMEAASNVVVVDPTVIAFRTPPQVVGWADLNLTISGGQT